MSKLNLGTIVLLLGVMIFFDLCTTDKSCINVNKQKIEVVK